MRAICALPACILLLSCSPYVYSDQTGKFSTSIGTAATAYRQGQEDDAAEQRTTMIAALLNHGRPRLELSPDCADDSKVCTIIMMSDDEQRQDVIANGTIAPAPPEPQEKDACDTVGAPAFPNPQEPNKGLGDPERTTAEIKSDQIFTVVQHYAAGLNAVTQSRDREEFNAAKATLAASVGTMVSTAGTAFGGIGAAAGPVAAASTNITLWLVGTDLDHQRYETLRRETIAACRPIKVLAGVIEFIIETQRGNRLDTLNRELREHFRTLDRIRTQSTDQAYTAEITATYATLDRYEAVRKIDPFALESAIDTAHDTLVLAIYENDGQVAAVTAALDTLSDSVTSLRAATETTSSSGTSATTTD